MYLRCIGFILTFCPMVLFAFQLNPYHYEVVKKGQGKNGAVVSAHPLASKVGIMILQKGGNAVDAAIATQLALAVVYPVAGNIGGGGFMLFRLKDGQTKILDFREKAPLAAYKNMYVDKDNTKYRYAQDGALAVGVPGSVSGFFAALQYANLPFKDLIAPAILLAKKGFVITEKEANNLNKHKKKFLKFNNYTIPLVKENGLWIAGDTLVQTDLAATLERIRDFGEDGFYQGKTAALIVATMQALGGIITLEDLQKYTTRVRIPITFSYKNRYKVITMPPPSSGGIILKQVLTMVEQNKNKIKNYRFHSPESVQLIIEAERRAYADKSVYGGDPDFVKVPLKTLLDDAYIQARMSDFTPNKAGSNQFVKEGVITESEETTHLNVADKEGNIVSITTTLNGEYGSCVMVKGAGFLLNNEMDDFTTLPGRPNLYGTVDGENNAVAPEKRMMSSMTPSIVLKNDKPFVVLGTPGGTTIPTSVIQTIVNIIDFNKDIQTAIDAPKFHFQRIPDTVFVESDFPENITRALEKMGYIVKTRKRTIGKVEVIQFLPNGKMEAAADKRGDDAAEAY